MRRHFSLERFTKGLETVHRQLRRNLLGELGFNVNYEGIVMDVDPSGCAAEDGVKQSSRLVEVSDLLMLIQSTSLATATLRPNFHRRK